MRFLFIYYLLSTRKGILSHSDFETMRLFDMTEIPSTTQNGADRSRAWFAEPCVYISQRMIGIGYRVLMPSNLRRM